MRAMRSGCLDERELETRISDESGDWPETVDSAVDAEEFEPVL